MGMLAGNMLTSNIEWLVYVRRGKIYREQEGFLEEVACSVHILRNLVACQEGRF